MPIYMDRHDVSQEVTAEIVADLHQKDLKIQHKFNCKGLTYWFDDKRKTAFCLVEAPSKAALKEMHDQAHGEVPHKIIEVDHAVVESFLGRIEDPEKSVKTQLNIINDPAFRTIMVVGIRPRFLKDNLDRRLHAVIGKENESILASLRLFKGRLARQRPDHILASFESVSKAVLCALEIQKVFEGDSGKNPFPLCLNIGLAAGVPVDKKDGFFEDTIKAAHSYCDLVQGPVVLSSEVKELYESENHNTPIVSGAVVSLDPNDEKFVKDLVGFTEAQWYNTSLRIQHFCRHLGLSKSGLYRRMIALTGKSPNHYLKLYRLTRAWNLLHKKEKNISEVASETGFNSPAYFSKCFEETFGILPSQYIKSPCS